MDQAEQTSPEGEELTIEQRLRSLSKIPRGDDWHSVAWQSVARDLSQAVFERDDIKFTDDEQQAAIDNFWGTMATVLERAELDHPGVTDDIMRRFEEIGQERRDEELERARLDNSFSARLGQLVRKIFKADTHNENEDL